MFVIRNGNFCPIYMCESYNTKRPIPDPPKAALVSATAT